MIPVSCGHIHIRSLCGSRFDLLANGGASITLSYERAPFPTLHRTVWLPWNVFHVMDTVVMKREENDIPSCYLTGLVRPNPLILATPLSTLYKTSPEDSPIIPETQVRTRELEAFSGEKRQRCIQQLKGSLCYLLNWSFFNCFLLAFVLFCL